MTYFYHGVPENMIGNKLVPLNNMEGELNKTKAQHLKKYEGREEILERKIPLLNCLWNDVVQFLPLHPKKVFQLQVEMGLIPELPRYKFFQIEVDSFDPEKTVVFFKDSPGEESVTVKWLKDVDLEAIQEIPEATINYYKTLVGTGELPFNYQFIPHVLHLGPVDISKAKIKQL
jgi:hypothetical protein